jgi:hypothetical protein
MMDLNSKNAGFLSPVLPIGNPDGNPPVPKGDERY